MFDYNDTLILFGRSPFINEIKDEIPKLIKKYHTMGCNYFCESFPDVEYVIFYDDITPKINEKSIIVTNICHFTDKRKKSYNLCHYHKNIQFYTVNKNKDDFSLRDSQLNFYIHTPSMALNWAVKNGFKTVILAGIDLNYNKEHFDKNTAPDKDTHTINDADMINAREHIYKIGCKYLQIYQLNPKSDMALRKITIKELLENVDT